MWQRMRRILCEERPLATATELQIDAKETEQERLLR
jgi:hypothetical protein